MALKQQQTKSSADVLDLSAGTDKAILNFPAAKSMRIQQIDVTPDIAAHWLKMNRANRKIYQDRVISYSTQMTNGQFMANGDTIRFSKSQRLLDGQHRLYAIIDSGVTIPILVVAGLDDVVAPTIDTGKIRTARDVLGIEGLDEWSAGVLGTGLQTIMNMESGRPLYSTGRFTNAGVREVFLEREAEFRRSVEFMKSLPRRRPPVAHSMGFVMHYLFSKLNDELADTFIRRLYTGEELTTTSPIYQLREKLIAAQLDRRTIPTFEKYYGLVRAWNLVRERRTIKTAAALTPKKDDKFPDLI